MKILTAGQKAVKAASDTTDYDLREVAHAETEDVGIELRKSIENYRDLILEPEFCVIYLRAKDKLIKNLIRKKFFCWPFLPKPRPNQIVFLYKKSSDKIEKRLWALPCSEAMALLSEFSWNIPREFIMMKIWSMLFYKGYELKKPEYFWDYIRSESNVKIPSEYEYRKSNPLEFGKYNQDTSDKDFDEKFDFSNLSFGKNLCITSTQSPIVGPGL